MSSALNPSARTFVPTTSSPTSLQSFPQLQNLQDEIILAILSFVSDVPYESTTDKGKAVKSSRHYDKKL